MLQMKNIKHFERELNLIVNEDLRMAVKSYMEEATPDYFWTDGASSSGKYHPKFSQGEGGLVRHTKAVVMFAEELLRMSSYAYMREEYKDYVIVIDNNKPEVIAKKLNEVLKYSRHECSQIGLKALKFAKSKNYKNQGKKIIEFIK